MDFHNAPLYKWICDDYRLKIRLTGAELSLLNRQGNPIKNSNSKRKKRAVVKKISTNSKINSPAINYKKPSQTCYYFRRTGHSEFTMLKSY